MLRIRFALALTVFFSLNTIAYALHEGGPPGPAAPDTALATYNSITGEISFQ